MQAECSGNVGGVQVCVLAEVVTLLDGD